jgi:hypothetical protein
MEQLDAHFSAMTRVDFHELLAKLIKSGPQSAHLLISLARKLYEDASFSDGLEEHERIFWTKFADDIFAQVVSTYSDEQEVERLSIFRAWDASKDLAERFGYKSGAMYMALAPHVVFRS